MKNCKVYILVLLCAFTTCLSLEATTSPVTIVQLKTEYAETPLGIDVKTPRFSWQMQTELHQSAQTAYRIVVTDENGQQAWDSGKIDSSLSLNINYGGQLLQPCTRYHWEVTVWDQKKKKHTASSWFETGMMSGSDPYEGWSNAQWIGGGDEDMVLYAPYLPVFKINYSMQLDEKSQSVKAAFVYGANDSRLMHKYKNLYQLENPKDSSYLSVELDVSPLAKQEPAMLHIYRVGYHPEDRKGTPYTSFRIPESLISPSTKYGVHTFYITSVLGYTQIYLDGELQENRVGEVNLNPLGSGGDFIAFPVVGEVGFSVPEGQEASFSKLEIRNFRSPSNVLASQEVLGNAVKGGKEGTFKVTDPSANAMPMLRTTFSTERKDVRKARLYVTSRGIYDVYMNGERISEDYFNPGLTQYNKTHMYQTFDVTDRVANGENVVGAVLGEGWWSGGAMFVGEFWNFFGDRQSLLAKLVVTYADGTEQVVTTDPATWKYYNDGPVRYSSFFQGQVYDATKEAGVEGWSTASYNDRKWKAAVQVTTENHVSLDPVNRHSNMPMVDDYSCTTLIGQFGQTVKGIQELTAVSVEEVRPGVFVYDMGQNMAGTPKIRLTGMEPGKEITLRFAEVNYPDLPEYGKNTGMIMLENIRAAMAQDTYITRGGEEVIHPRFTFHGYRFIEVTGIDKALPLSAVKTDVLSSIDKVASHYETSNPKVNKLWENIKWSTYSNFLSIPTDCPQRNERLGWSGDISVFSRAATYLSDLPQFLRRHMLAMRDSQREDGRFSDVAPLGGGFGGILWGSAGITVAWESYQQYQDAEMLAEHYPAMKRYITYLEGEIDLQTNIMGNKYRGNWGSLGDWLSPEYDRSEKSLLWEAYFIYDLGLMHKVATVLGHTEDARYFANLCSERKAFFNKVYIDPETGKTIYPDAPGKLVDTQISYVLPFAFDLLTEENRIKALPHFVESITRTNRGDIGTECPPYSLMTGFIGTAWISRALSDCGYTDVAYRLLQQTSYPSWLYSVDQGATTIWERLNSYTHTNGFGGNNQMNSFNHYSFGAVCSWMYNYSLGIERDEESPGFKHFILKPEPDPTGEMTHAKGYYDSMYGRIESEWYREGSGYRYVFTVPANTTATLYLPAVSAKQILAKGKQSGQAKGVKYIGRQAGKQVYELSAGSYVFLMR